MRFVKEKRDLAWWKKAICIAAVDILTIICSYFFALMLRHDFVFSIIPQSYVMGYLSSLPYWCAVTLAVFFLCRMYHSIWSFAGIAELWMILKALVRQGVKL